MKLFEKNNNNTFTKKNAKLKLSFLIVQTFSKSTSHKLNIFFNKNVSFLLHCSKYDFITFTHFTSMFLSYFNDFLKIWDTSIVCFRSSSLRDKVFKNGSSKICVRQPLKIWRDIVCLSRPYHFKFFKGCLPQILLGPFLNTLSLLVVNSFHKIFPSKKVS